ncbi:MAG TPA: agmatine deiminase family protein [Blastocatellia bacterium]|nr:agmatine deiminase family protein [Blastocatellia bacterium]
MNKEMNFNRSVLLICFLGIAALLLPLSSNNVVTADAKQNSSGDDEWLFPGEFESHQAMWMLWPTYENKAGFPSTDPISDMIRAMSGRVHVNLAVQDADDEAAARSLLTGKGVPLDHVHFFQIEHGDIWARDMGPQFTRGRSGKLRINDWNFDFWGYEEPDSELSLFDEPFDRTVASIIKVPTLDARAGSVTGVRMVHEGGSVTHNGHGTMIAVESVVMQRNMGPNSFCGGRAPVTDHSQPNTYAPNPDWPYCKALVENEYRRMLGVKKIIWVPTGMIEDTGTFRGALAKHIRVPKLNGIDIPHAGVYTMFGVNGHADEFLRFVSPNTVVLAQETPPNSPATTPVEKLQHWFQERNHELLERVYDIISEETTESGEPIRVVRIPTPVPIFDALKAGDGTYDYFANYDRWEDGSTLPEIMLGVWNASYVNYVPTNDLVIVSKFWKPGLPLEIRKRDNEARAILEAAFPGRKIAQVYAENVNRGGGGMNCITQQQPASAKFAQKCGWAKVQVAAQSAALYTAPIGGAALGSVPRLTTSGEDVYLKRLSSWGKRALVLVTGEFHLNGRIGWIDEDDIESAGEKCSLIYSPN